MSALRHPVPMSFPPFFCGLPFTGRQAGKKLNWLLGGGEIRQLLKGVYVATETPDSPELRAAAAALVIPSDGVARAETAAWIHGIPTAALSADEQVPIRWTRTPAETVNLAGHKVTSPAATGVELALHLPRPFALASIDALLRSGRADRATLEGLLDQYDTHQAQLRARNILKHADPRAESPAESWLRLRLLDAGFPKPDLQVRVSGPTRDYRLDLSYPDPIDGVRLGLEYDSDRWHSSDRDQVRDEERRTGLKALGWHIIPVRRTDLWGSYPALELAVGAFLCRWPRLPRRW
ncbi:type IV toxin-antitoxin system AbiEi family antitoxin domain-containing protein [Kribbella koreensis]|uniref:Type IV toxin-antitoxin system AbiEi family antitoxin domain-containing protein n=2 Tax=Kribbella koreensis TaxID=57909 RepID=A0ABN1PP72_9ACTN